jgi:hypothetical protein
MDSDESSDEEWQCGRPLKKPKLEPIPRVAHVRSLAPVELQRFIEQPPGEGMAVIYAFVNIKDGKVYVGKHEHANGGQSFWESRCHRHLKPAPSAKKTYFANAMRKHGKESFEYYIIWHGLESEVNDQERFWIGPDGLHTIKDNGGWGYNSREGGEGGRFAPSVVVELKKIHNTEETLQKHRAAGKAQADREKEIDPQYRSRRAKLQWENADRETRTEWSQKQSEAQSRPEVLEKHRVSGKAQWENASDDTRAEWRQKFSDAQNRPDVKEKSRLSGIAQWANAPEETRAEWRRKISESQNRPDVKEKHRVSGKAQWENASHDTRAEWCQKLSDAQNRPDVKEKSRLDGLAQAAREKEADPGYRSRRAKEQAEREAAAGKPSLGERGKATQVQNWSEEKWQEVLKKRFETKQRNIAKLKALKKLEGFGNVHLNMGQKMISKAESMGVSFFQDASGEWRARMGECAGSSAEHAAMRTEEDLVLETVAEDCKKTQQITNVSV